MKKVFSLFIFTRLYYLCFSPEAVYEKIRKRIKKLLRKNGLHGFVRKINRRFFWVAEGEIWSDVLIIRLRNKKEIRIEMTDGDTSHTGIRRISLMDLTRQHGAQIVRTSFDESWLW